MFGNTWQIIGIVIIAVLFMAYLANLIVMKFGFRRTALPLILLLLTLGLAGVGHAPETPWVVLALTLAVALVSATQDIALDAYAVDVLRPEEHGVAVGARTAVYRAAMFVAGGLAISAAAVVSWPAVCAGLALLYLPMLLVTWKAPERRPPRCGRRSGSRSSDSCRATARSRSSPSWCCTSSRTVFRNRCCGLF